MLFLDHMTIIFTCPKIGRQVQAWLATLQFHETPPAERLVAISAK
jgi:hypothetical protein